MNELENNIILLHQLESVIIENIEKSKIYPKLFHVWDLNTKLLEDYKNFRNVGLKPALARGLIAEIMCTYVLKHWSNEKGLNYKILSNLLIPRMDGGTTQLDLVLITNDFAIVIECKSLYGRITINNGTVKTATATMEPWKQNMGHIMSLKEVLKDYNLYFHNMMYIFSFGSITEYTPVVDQELMVNVNSFDILNSIRSNTKTHHYNRLSDSELDEIEELLVGYIPNVVQEVDHIRFIEETIRDK